MTAHPGGPHLRPRLGQAGQALRHRCVRTVLASQAADEAAWRFPVTPARYIAPTGREDFRSWTVAGTGPEKRFAMHGKPLTVTTAFRSVCLGAALLIGLVVSAWPQEQPLSFWPSRTVKIVTPLAAGGAADIVGRTVGDALLRHLKQSVIIDNRPGGGGTLAASRCSECGSGWSDAATWRGGRHDHSVRY